MIRQVLIFCVISFFSYSQKVDSLVLYHRALCAEFRTEIIDSAQVKNSCSFKVVIKDSNAIKKIFKELSSLKKGSRKFRKTFVVYYARCYSYQYGEEKMLFDIIGFKRLKIGLRIYDYDKEFIEHFLQNEMRCYFF